MLKRQSERLGVDPIGRLLAELTIPATVGMLAMALHSVIDAIYIGRGVGAIGVAAVAITFPLSMLIMAISGAIGIGGASVISINLGAGRLDRANLAFGNILLMILIVGIAGLFLGLTFLEQLLKLFAASETILPLSKEYLGIILYGTIFFSFSFAVNNIVRAEGNARVAMGTMIISSFLNIIFTPIFMFAMKLGMSGAAYGTVTAQGLTSFYLIYYYGANKSTLTINLKYIKLNIRMTKQILSIGASAFVRQGASSIMLIIANHMLVFYGGDMAIAVLGIIHRVMMFTLMPIMGIVQGMMPVVGFNYGAQKKLRVREAITLSMKLATLIATAGFLVVMFFPALLIKVFTDDPVLIDMGRSALCIMFAMAFTVGIQMVTGGVFQALGKAREAFIMSMARQILFLIPMLFLLPPLIGLKGVWLSFPVADAFSFLLAIWLILRHKKYFFLNSEKILAVSK
jgi:putative MATE family efflux protein